MDIGVIEEIVNSIKEEPQDTNTIYSAEVAHIDSEGRPWVYLAGSTKETPVERASAEVKSGDYVNVEWRNNKLYIAGNYSNPSAGVTRVVHVEQTADQAQADATAASSAASAASEAASSAVQSAATAAEAAETATNSLKSVVSGATTVEKAVSVMQTALEAVVDYDPSTDTTKEYFWHDANGAHVLGTSGAYRNDITSTGMKIMDTSTETSVAEFGSNGAQIGRTGAAHSVIDADGQRFYASDGTTQLANIGYGQGQGGGGSSIATAPFYTLGLRGSDLTTSRGNWSVVEGFQNTANGYGSHAEGYQTATYGDLSHTEGYKTEARNTNVPTSQGAYLQAASHAEGYQSIATGQASHAEGYQTNSNNTGTHSEGYGTTASGYYSHAEGYDTTASGATAHASGASTTASGDNSTAVGLGTTAQRRGQLCAGEYNKLDTGGANAGTRGNYAFIVGNGASNSSRSDALTVDWGGNLTAAGDITDGGGNVLSNKLDASTLADYVTEQGTSGSWRYRKWNSGKIEAWFEGTFSCAASTTARGSLYYSTWSLTIPSAIGFTATPNTLIGNTGDSNTVIAVNGAATSKTAMSGKVWRYASSSSALTISAKIYAWQD